MTHADAINAAYDAELQSMFGVLVDGLIMEHAEAIDQGTQPDPKNNAAIRFARGVAILKTARELALSILETS